ncbi:tetratricopeptide repeat protein [Maridesulfovibrio bastinii]|uniref:tetratricopeptide repeat protein n=1 Tax=Maridesulfovibrio bastinii TaxID=47157 RepID=UPI001FDEE805|nr:tetratricopeptide repeat protein [Maridesulfovibrio bastinii]
MICFVCPQPVLAMEYFINTGPDMDSLRFTFDSKKLNPRVRRTGKQQITLSFPSGALNSEKAPTPLPLSSMRILNSIDVGSSAITINTKTNAFGYIRIPAGNGELKIQFFRDPFGARWVPPKKNIPASPKNIPASSVPAQEKQQAPQSAPAGSIPVPTKEDTAPAAKVAPVPGVNSGSVANEADISEPPQANENAAPVGGNSDGNNQSKNVRPFYSVPYAYRAPISKVGPGEAKAVSTSVAPPSGDSAQPSVQEGGEISGPSAGGEISGPSAGGAISGPSAGGEISGPSAGGAISGPSAGGEISGPSAGGEISGPSAGGAISGPSAGGEIPGPSAGGEISGPSAGGEISGPSAGGEISGPSAGGEIPGPSAGGAISGPSAGNEISGPSAGGEIPGPSAGGEISGPSAGGEISGPSAGGAIPSPSAGGEISGPSAGGAISGPSAGGAISGPSAGGEISGPSAGGEISGPSSDSSISGLNDEGATQQIEPLPAASIEANNTVAASQTTEPFINGTDSGAPSDNNDAYPAEQISSADADQPAAPPTLEERITTAKGLLLAAESSLESGQLEAALTGFTEVVAMHDMPKDIRMRALYGKAEAVTETHKDDLVANFNTVTSAWMEAMNADTNSPDVPDALLNLGLANLKVGNMPEAKAYFNLLKSQYPNNLNIPYISYYWGQYYLDKKDYTKAADQFQYLVQRYPDSKVVREAALGLSKALHELGYNEQAAQILDYIDKRWPRFYIEYPQFLLMSANSENTLGKLDAAKDHYWAYYNLLPESDENDIVLARLGDIYLRQGDKRAAKEIYQKAVDNYPDKEGGLISKMRLAEEGIYDDPSMAQMDKVFDRPYNLRPQKIYTSIVEDHPDSPLAPLAQLKLAMWYYWNKKYGECLGAVSDFIDKYPRSSLLPKAKELGLKVFDRAVPELVKDENYSKVISFWNSYGLKGDKADGINDDTRMGVALSYWKKGQPDVALKLVDRYLQEKQVPKYSTMALDMALGIYVDDQSWSDVVSLVDMVDKNWKVGQKQQAQMKYATAMAYENLGETERSTPLWAGLASNLLLPSSSRAYAMYYMAKSAMKKKDLKKLFVYSQEALSMLLETGGDREKIKDSILMTIYSAESSARYREALKWAAEYDKYIPESDSEWASSRFRLAQLYEKAGAIPEWKKLMEEVAQKRPDGLYGRLANSALESHKIENEASKFK